MSDRFGAIATDEAIARADQVTRRAVGRRWAAAGDATGGPVRLGATELAQVILDGQPTGAPVVAYLGPAEAPASADPVELVPTTDRAPQGWRLVKHVESIPGLCYTGVEGFFLGTGTGTPANQGANQALQTTTFTARTILAATSSYQWIRPGGVIRLVHGTWPFTANPPMSMRLEYQITNEANPSGSGWIECNYLQAVDDGDGHPYPRVESDRYALDDPSSVPGTWYRVDGRAPAAIWNPSGQIIIQMRRTWFGEYLFYNVSVGYTTYSIRPVTPPTAGSNTWGGGPPNYPLYDGPWTWTLTPSALACAADPALSNIPGFVG